jgi:hypothetical protein
MKRGWSIVATTLVVLGIVVAGAAALAWNALPLDGTTVWIDGESFSLAERGGAPAVAGFASAFVVSLAALALAACGVAVGLAAAAIGIGIGVLATAASLALIASPFLLVGWLLWRVLRKPASSAPVASA